MRLYVNNINFEVVGFPVVVKFCLSSMYGYFM